MRTVEAATRPGGGTIEIEPAIEVGNIFKLGTRYSEPLGATYLDERERAPIVMGSYGIGPARIVAAAIEQGGRARHRLAAALAPWQVQLVSLAKAGEPEREAPTTSTRSCASGAEVLYDDRDAGPGRS